MTAPIVVPDAPTKDAFLRRARWLAWLDFVIEPVFSSLSALVLAVVLLMIWFPTISAMMAPGVLGDIFVMAFDVWLGGLLVFGLLSAVLKARLRRWARRHGTHVLPWEASPETPRVAEYSTAHAPRFFRLLFVGIHLGLLVACLGSVAGVVTAGGITELMRFLEQCCSSHGLLGFLEFPLLTYSVAVSVYLGLVWPGWRREGSDPPLDARRNAAHPLPSART